MNNKKLIILFTCIINAQFSFGQYPNLVENPGFIDPIEGSWSLNVNSGAAATFEKIVEPNWEQVDKPRGKVYVTTANDLESVYITSEDKFVFSGRPRLVQDNDELVGDKIIFYKGGKRVQVMKARARVDKKRLEKLD